MATGKNEKIKEILTRAVEEVIVKKDLEKALRSGKKLRVKFGIDPTAPDLHLGHTVALRKLKEFQNLGHKIVFIIGDFTGMIGDPSDKSETRKILTEKKVKGNMKKYLKQAGKIINIKKAEIHHNGEWYKKKSFSFFDLASKITVQRILERDDFQKRIKSGKEITMLEALYPILQGYDSVAVKADVEIGGTDQKFNLLMGRRMQERYSLPAQNILTIKLIEGTDGVRKMSKSFDNYIGLEESPEEMFGKLMRIPDDLIAKYFETLTGVSANKIKTMKKKMKSKKLNPRDAKLELGEEVVKIYHDAKTAKHARKRFVSIFTEKKLKNLPKLKVKKGDSLRHVILKNKMAKSYSDIKRLVEGGAVEISGEKVFDQHKKIESGGTLKVGKKNFVEITV